MSEVDIDLVAKKQKWCTAKFFIGIASMITSKFFIAWLMSTIFCGKAVFDTQTDAIKKILIICWAAITVIWMLSNALSKFIGEGKLSVEAKANLGLSKEIKGDLSQLLETLKKQT